MSTYHNYNYKVCFYFCIVLFVWVGIMDLV